jgi:large subunit ribosomal protein L1
MEGFSPDKSLTLTDAFQQLSNFEKVNFDETIELSCSLGVDPKQSSQGVRGTINLPHGSGKDVKVIVFTDNAEEAKKAGADHAGLDDLISKVKDGWTDSRFMHAACLKIIPSF